MESTATQHELECDYLVVGAGAASLAFVDTLLTELPNTKVILIDKKGAPGGHWVNAYGFVQLHQPSRFYGIASSKLEANSVNPSKHRANKQEILHYFRNFVDTKVSSGQLSFYPNCIYKFKNGKGDERDDGTYCVRSVDGSKSYSVTVNVKLVDGTKGECIIPHDSPLQFPVDKDVKVMTPNQIYDDFQRGSHETRSMLQRNKYVVLGAGKTGIDCVVYLQRTMMVDPADIAWVISRDVWLVNSNSKANPQTWARCLAKHENDFDKAALSLEDRGLLVRLDKNFLPSRFRFPVIPPDELQLARNVTTVIRCGRVTSIRRIASSVVVDFGASKPSWEAFAPIESCIFVHATSPGPFNELDPTTPIFNNPKQMTLQLILMGPRTFSMSLLAKIEAARRNKTLDIDFMRDRVLRDGLCKDREVSTENEILNIVIMPLAPAIPHRPLLSLATILAILDRDPLVTMNWMRQNRLCFLSVPKSKVLSYDDIQMLLARGGLLGLSEFELSMLQVLEKKLGCLKGL